MLYDLCVPTLLVLLLVHTPPVTTSSGFDAEALSSIIETSHHCRQHVIPGLAVSVVKDGVTLLSRGYGVTRLHGNESVNGDTRFNVASLTKAITAAILVKLMDESRVYNLSTPVRDILGPDFRFEDNLRTQQATVEDLLSHKMAIPGNMDIRFSSTLTRRTLVHRVRYLKSHDTFRTTFIYSNVMYGLASRVAEVVAGRGRWEELVRRHLFTPLGMRRSTFTSEADLSEPNTAKPYAVYNDRLEPLSDDLFRRYYSELVGSGAFITTANDMTSWMNFHLSQGRGPSPQTNQTNQQQGGGGEGREGGARVGAEVMRQELVQELHKPRTAMPTPMPLFQQPAVPVAFSFDVYALGWWNGYYRGYPVLAHSGSSFGYVAFVALVPSLKAGVFIGMNGDDKNRAYRGTLLSLILDHLIGGGVTPWVDVNALCTFPYPWHNVTAVPPPLSDDDAGSRPLAHNISSYPGVYHNPAYGQLEVRLVSGIGDKASPRLTVLYGFARWDLVPLLPKNAAAPNSTSTVSSRTGTGVEEPPEYFYGIGKGINAFEDCTPFLVHPPPAGSDGVIGEISVPGFEERLPPVFKRVTSASVGGGSTTASSCVSTLGAQTSAHVLALSITFALFVSRWLPFSVACGPCY